MIKYEPKPVDTSPARDEDLSPEELIRRERELREARRQKAASLIPHSTRLKIDSFTLPGDRVAREEIHVDPEAIKVNHPVKVSQTAMVLKELEEDSVKKDEKVTQRQRVRAVMIPEGFHTCGDPKCAATEILRLRREGERRRTALSRKSSKASRSARS